MDHQLRELPWQDRNSLVHCPILYPQDKQYCWNQILVREGRSIILLIFSHHRSVHDTTSVCSTNTYRTTDASTTQRRPPSSWLYLLKMWGRLHSHWVWNRARKKALPKEAKIEIPEIHITFQYWCKHSEVPVDASHTDFVCTESGASIV